MTALLVAVLLMVMAGLFMAGFAYGRERAFNVPKADSDCHEDTACAVRLYADGTVAVLDGDGHVLARYMARGGLVS